MKKNAFTLIEIIFCIVLLIVIGSTTTVLTINVNKNTIKKQKNNLYDSFDNAMEVYLETNPKIYDNLFNNVEGAVITLELLKNEGLIKDNLIDPETKQNIDYKNNYYVLSNAQLLADPSEGGEEPIDCSNTVSLEVIKSWKYLTDGVQTDEIMYICPNDFDSLKNEFADLESKLNEQETKINSLTEAINNITGRESEDVKQNLIYDSFYSNLSYIAKGIDPYNYVEFEVESNVNNISYFPNDDEQNLWRIVSIKPDGEMKLIYNKPVGTDNSKNLSDDCLSYRISERYSGESDAYDKEHNHDIFCRLNYISSGFDQNYYYYYDNNSYWSYNELINDETERVGSKQNAIFNSIINKSWIVINKYNMEYLVRSSGSITLDDSGFKELYLGTLSLNEYNESKLFGNTWLNYNDNHIIGIGYDESDNETNIRLSGGNVYSKNLLLPLTYCRNSTCSKTKTRTDTYYIRGNKYVPVITLNKNVELIENENCDENDIKGSETCPYKLSCTNC